MTHYSWLLSGNHAHAAAVRDAIRDKLRQRSIAKLNVNPETLTERGILMEEREYVVAQRGASTIFIYAAPAGQDLYISRATTALPAISYIRALILGVLFLILVFGFVSLQSLQSTYSPYGPLGLFFNGPLVALFVLAFYPLLLFFIGFLIRAFISWLVEKDFWRDLRPNVLNDFQLDDIALLEHVTDDIVHDSVEQVGLDASKIVPPPLGYQLKAKIRAI